ncbi:hypothetical protein GCM10029978_120080 [Actinoallomurus acanthiterrae]
MAEIVILLNRLPPNRDPPDKRGTVQPVLYPGYQPVSRVAAQMSARTARRNSIWWWTEPIRWIMRCSRSKKWKGLETDAARKWLFARSTTPPQ